MLLSVCFVCHTIVYTLLLECCFIKPIKSVLNLVERQAALETESLSRVDGGSLPGCRGWKKGDETRLRVSGHGRLSVHLSKWANRGQFGQTEVFKCAKTWREPWTVLSSWDREGNLLLNFARTLCSLESRVTEPWGQGRGTELDSRGLLYLSVKAGERNWKGGVSHDACKSGGCHDAAV